MLLHSCLVLREGGRDGDGGICGGWAGGLAAGAGMTVGALAGYWLGAHSAQRIPAAVVRQVVTGIGLVLAALTFWKEFAGK